MKKIGIILIRKSSKGLVDKNIKLFCGRPLCFHTIDVALESGKFDEVWIFSDSEEYLDICREEYGEKCIYKIRDENVSLDSSTTFDTLNYLFKDIQENFIFINLQVTSPIRKKEHILDAFDLFENCDHLVSFSNYRLNKSLFMDENDEYLIPSRHGDDYRR